MEMEHISRFLRGRYGTRTCDPLLVTSGLQRRFVLIEWPLTKPSVSCRCDGESYSEMPSRKPIFDPTTCSNRERRSRALYKSIDASLPLRI